MNSEEIRKALEIIKEPITVNCIEYKYFDQENYDKITRVYDNCLWFANNLEQIILTVEKLEQEKQEVIDYLKGKIKQCEELIIKHKECIKGVVNISDNNRHLILIKTLEIEKQTYQEILSKIEKE